MADGLPDVIPIEHALQTDQHWASKDGMREISKRVTSLMRWKDGNANWLRREHIYDKLNMDPKPTFEQFQFMLDNYTKRYPHMEREGAHYYRLNDGPHGAPHQDDEEEHRGHRRRSTH